jgi:hypothetical protein
MYSHYYDFCTHASIKAVNAASFGTLAQLDILSLSLHWHVWFISPSRRHSPPWCSPSPVSHPAHRRQMGSFGVPRSQGETFGHARQQQVPSLRHPHQDHFPAQECRGAARFRVLHLYASLAIAIGCTQLGRTQLCLAFARQASAPQGESHESHFNGFIARSSIFSFRSRMVCSPLLLCAVCERASSAYGANTSLSPAHRPGPLAFDVRYFLLWLFRPSVPCF